MSATYDADLSLWSEYQARLLRRIATDERANVEEPDWLNIAEEIESLGRSLRHELASHIRTIIEHLMKLDASPATEPHAGWFDTIARARSNIEELFEDSPSLKNPDTLDALIAREHIRARRQTATALRMFDEVPRMSLDDLRYTREQIIGD